MIYLILTILGLAFGSFVNALVWRTYMSKNKKRDLSVWQGRSMCTHCRHTLSPSDLVPVLSWAILRGKCRYCHKKIEDTPVAELLLPILFILSFILWPIGFEPVSLVVFAVWLVILVLFTAMLIYDMRWMILPDKFTVYFSVLAVLMVILRAIEIGFLDALVPALFGAVTIGGLFYLLNHISNGKWIGGGDVKLGFGLGLISGSPLAGLLVIFLSSVLGTLAVLPGIISKKLTYQDKLPFGPFLILATIAVFLGGEQLLDWYMSLLLLA